MMVYVVNVTGRKPSGGLATLMVKLEDVAGDDALEHVEAKLDDGARRLAGRFFETIEHVGMFHLGPK